MSLSDPDALRGGDAAHNAAVVRRLLEGERGAVRDAVLLNAGAALAVYDAPDAPVDTALAAGIEKAREAIDSGAARATLERWIAASAG
jgi:anthranilate phosphoribosyltransferase